MQLNPYLFFSGQCEAAFKFYAQVLGGKTDALLTHEGTPAENHVPAEWRSKIMHARMTIGDWVLMASDAPPCRSQRPQGFSVHISVDEPSEAERVFKALADGGQVRIAMDQAVSVVQLTMPADPFSTPHA